MKNENKWYMKEINGEDYVYHCFTFKPEIQEHSFIGVQFIGMNPSEKSECENIMNRVIEAGREGFLPEILEELKSLLEENNYEYDGYEIGEEEYSHYFFIKASLYKTILSKIEKWRDYNDYNELMYWDVKEI